jgi:tail tube protein gp19
MTYQHGANYDRWRQLGKPKFEDIKIQVGMGMSEGCAKWISEFFQGQGTRRNGVIMAGDYDYSERARREFRDALIKELVFPKLEGQDKNAAYMTLAFAVEELVFKKGDPSKKLQAAPGFDSQKAWTASNFRFRIDGMEAACANTIKVDSFTIKQNVLEYHAGSQRAPIKCPSQIDFPQVSFYIPEVDAEPLYKHFKKRGVDGEVPGRLTGMIQTFDNDEKKNELFTLSFAGADILNLQPEKLDSASEEILAVKVDLYVESMSFKYAPRRSDEKGGGGVA